MIDPQASKQLKPTTVPSPKISSGKMAIMSNSVRAEQIRERAYQLYEGRGREHGLAEQDWFRAEQELAKQQR
jgi:hypothetical protein